VSDPIAALLDRARRELAVVRTLWEAGFHEQADSRAYYAAFFAAEAALLSLGETRSKHAGVVSAFGRLVVKDGGLDAELGRSLRRLFERRNVADYDWLDDGDSSGAATDPSQIAEPFVEGVAAWIAARGRQS